MLGTLGKFSAILVIATMLMLSMASTSTDEHPQNQTNEKSSSIENTTAYRLPDNVVPNTYYIRLTPFIASNNFTFDGVVRIIANVTKKTSNIVLHVDNFKIHNVSVSSHSKKNGLTKLGVKNTTEQVKYNFLNIEMDLPIEVDTNITITITYTGKINEDIKGLFRNSYTINNETR